MRINKHGSLIYEGGDPCAGGCGGVSEPKSVLCIRCRKDKVEAPPKSDHDLEIYTEVLAEQIRDESIVQERLAERGTGVCGFCGRPSLPWRRYCSRGCRSEAGYAGGVEFELDGIKDSLFGHSKRLGIEESTVRKRMRVQGLSIVEALKRPVNLKKSFPGVKRKAS